MSVYAVRIDRVSDVLSYIGKAALGSLTSQAVWQIREVTIVGTETIISQADGDALFDNVWDDRVGLTYSQ